MTQRILLVFFVFNSIVGFSQSSIELISEKALVEYYSMSIFKALIQEDTLYLTCRVEENENGSDRLALVKIIEHSTYSTTLLKSKEYVSISDFKTLKNGFLMVGIIYVEDEKSQDYLGYFDHNGEKIWSLNLEKKYEGINRVFKSASHFTVITNGTGGLFKYLISYDGKIISKRKIPAHGYIVDALEKTNGELLILSITLNDKGFSEKWNIDFFSEDLTEKRHYSYDFENRYYPESFLEYQDGFLIAGNLDKEHAFIPLIYFLNQDLQLERSMLYHYEPEHYKFKSDFQLKDIKFNLANKKFIASGITKIANEETNIIFELNKDQILNYQTLDKTEGIWMNNTILFKSDGKYVFFGDSKSNAEYRTCIKMVDFYIK